MVAVPEGDYTRGHCSPHTRLDWLPIKAESTVHSLLLNADYSASFAPNPKALSPHVERGCKHCWRKIKLSREFLSLSHGWPHADLLHFAKCVSGRPASASDKAAFTCGVIL